MNSAIAAMQQCEERMACPTHGFAGVVWLRKRATSVTNIRRTWGENEQARRDASTKDAWLNNAPTYCHTYGSRFSFATCDDGEDCAGRANDFGISSGVLAA